MIRGDIKVLDSLKVFLLRPGYSRAIQPLHFAVPAESSASKKYSSYYKIDGEGFGAPLITKLKGRKGFGTPLITELKEYSSYYKIDGKGFGAPLFTELKGRGGLWCSSHY
jgi:hypothetical protein